MIPIYLKATKNYIEHSKYRQNGTGIGCAGTTSPRVTQKTDNPLKGIRNIVTNGIRSQWPRGLLGQRQNTTKYFRHIMGRGKEKPGGLFHKTPPNLAL